METDRKQNKEGIASDSAITLQPSGKLFNISTVTRANRQLLLQNRNTRNISSMKKQNKQKTLHGIIKEEEKNGSFKIV